MRKTLLSVAALAALAASGAAKAQTVGECDWRASAETLSEPWEKNSRTFANGAVRIAIADAIEPAAGALHLLVLSPPYHELGGRQCRVISLDGALGFSGIFFDELTASYDPARGLTMVVPVLQYDLAGGDHLPATLEFTLNQATGSIEAYLY